MAPITRTRHPTLYQNWGNITLAADDVIFRVHSGLLKSESKLFETLLQLPQPEKQGEDAKSVEGSCDENAIVLPVPALHLSLLLECVFHRSVELDTQQKLIVLDLASFLLMHDMRSWVLREIGRGSPSPTPTQLVAYGVRCQLPEWVSAGIYDLVLFPGIQPSDIRGEEANIMGFSVFSLLCDTVHKIYRIRLFIATAVGDFKAATTCRTPSQCKALWHAHVHGPFVQRYLHPQSPIKASKASFWLANCAAPHLCFACMDTNKTRLDDSNANEMWFLEEMAAMKADETLLAMLAPFPAATVSEGNAMSVD